MKWKHKDCVDHAAVGVFDGKRFKKVCRVEGDTDEDFEGQRRFAQEISSLIDGVGGA